DDMLGGFQKSDLIIIAARPSMGKTALALSITRNVALEYKIPVAFFSIEMASIQLVIRLLSAESRINAHDIRTGKLSGNSLPQIVQTIGRLAEAPIYIDDSPTLSIMEMRAKCRRLKSEHNIQLVVVDYLQLIHSPKAESREREISMISRSLKQIAKELDIAVIALAQLNRSVESRADKRPMLSDLRESGSIEQDADVVMFVNRPEYYGITTYDDGSPTQGTAELIIGKQRNGPVGDARVAYLKDFARFENLSFQYDEPPPYMDGFDQLDTGSPF
ncbi:MAG TPA: replicative DNA helicase, partial [Patescibacteria group bacterium]|nr:replicative DNA helicase [Patescibacteria group bacterium]